jgi:hypothetical protein
VVISEKEQLPIPDVMRVRDLFNITSVKPLIPQQDSGIWTLEDKYNY